MQHISTDPQQTLHQPVGPVGEPQVVQAGVLTVPAHHGSLAWLQPKLVLHQVQAAADSALVHGQGDARLGLGTGQLEEIEDVQVFQRRGWGVGAGGPLGCGVGGTAAGVVHGRDERC